MVWRMNTKLLSKYTVLIYHFFLLFTNEKSKIKAFTAMYISEKKQTKICAGLS
jgi:hypothetical protein